MINTETGRNATENSAEARRAGQNEQRLPRPEQLRGRTLNTSSFLRRFTSSASRAARSSSSRLRCASAAASLAVISSSNWRRRAPRVDVLRSTSATSVSAAVLGTGANGSCAGRESGAGAVRTEQERKIGRSVKRQEAQRQNGEGVWNLRRKRSAE